jgi:hypothetical protein
MLSHNGKPLYKMEIIPLESGTKKYRNPEARKGMDQRG